MCIITGTKSAFRVQFNKTRHWTTFSLLTFGCKGSVYMTQRQLSRQGEFTPVPSCGSILTNFAYMIPPQNAMPAPVHPSCCTGAENFTPVQNFSTVSCKRKTTTSFGMKSVCQQTGMGSACIMFAILNHTCSL